MSAFVVNKGHIDALVRAGLAHTRDGMRWRHRNTTHTLDYTTPDQVGQMLLDQNLRSVRHRYREGPESNDLPGPVDPYWTEPYRWPIRGRVPTALEALKLLDCYEYQSCEGPDWRASSAYSFVLALRAHLIAALPGYEEAAWEWRG